MGRIISNEHPAKAAREVRVGDRLRVKNDAGEFHIDVLALSEQRGPAALAQGLYQETEESKNARARLAEERKAEPRFEGAWEGRPSKKDRRVIERWRGRG